jgi:hypothetical protein
VKVREQKWSQVCCCSASIACVLANAKDLDGSELGSGRVTGQLLNLTEIGGILLIVALLLTFLVPRVATAVTLTAALLCLPLYLYFVAPGPFRWVFRGEYSVPLTSNFTWTSWPILGIVAFAVTTWVCLFGIRGPTD